MTVQRRVRVAVNGYGVIGKRVADAIRLQDDMDLVGVADVVSDYRIRVAAERGYPIFAAVPERRVEMEAAGVPIAGALDDLLAQVDIVADCAPKTRRCRSLELVSAGMDVPASRWPTRAGAIVDGSSVPPASATGTAVHLHGQDAMVHHRWWVR